MKTPMFAGLFACHSRQNTGFPPAPITVQNGRLLAPGQNAIFHHENKAFPTMLHVVCAFFRLKRWAIVASPSGTKVKNTAGSPRRHANKMADRWCILAECDRPRSQQCSNARMAVK